MYYVVIGFFLYILYKHFCPRPASYNDDIRNYVIDESKLSMNPGYLQGIAEALYGGLYVKKSPEIVITSLRGRTIPDLNAINKYFGLRYDAIHQVYKNLPEFLETELNAQDYAIVRDLVRGSNIIVR